MSEPTPPAGEPLPYHEICEPHYAQQAAATFKVEDSVPGMVTLSGLCPRCGAFIQVPHVDGAFKGIWRDRENQAARETRTVICVCTSEADHTHRPADRLGCGAYWALELVGHREADS